MAARGLAIGACRLRLVHDHVEALIGRRRHEKTCELIEFRLAHLERMGAGGVAFPEPLFAQGVRHVEPMKLVRDLCLVNQRARPLTLADGVCREIENDREFVPQDVDDERGNGRAQPRRMARVVFDRLQLVGKQRRVPVVLADQQGRRPAGELPRQGRFAGGDLSADQM